MGLAGKPAGGIEVCRDGLRAANEGSDPNMRGFAHLYMAEVLLSGGRKQEAADEARLADEAAVTANLIMNRVIAALIRGQGSEAVLAELSQKWGAEAMPLFLARPDVAKYLTMERNGK